MSRVRLRWTLFWSLLALAGLPPAVLRADPPKGWDRAAAARYLDGRAKGWQAWEHSQRGEGADQTSCVSCHTLLPYALGRPVLRKLSGEARPTEFETRLLEQVKKRVSNWDKLDTPRYRLYYDSGAARKKESWGTEAVLDALVLAWDDRARGRASSGEVTRKALEHLWQTQVRDGDPRGSWDWLNFGLEPWEAPPGRYYGAALAAVAVGTAPGYYRPGADAKLDGHIDLLRAYLRDRLPGQNLYNRALALWAAAKLPGTLTDEQQRKVIGELFEKQQADGGWRLASLGNYRRGDNTAQDPASDGYATGLVVHVLRTAGVSREDPRLARGLAWLRGHQDATGAWLTNSVNRRRDPATNVGRFMSDAATAYAILALGEP
jgi:squalene-hopene/tetraprenyl-beta-curcumene cyclase